MHYQLRVTLLAYAVANIRRMGLEFVAFIAQKARLIDHVREVATGEPDILLGFRLQVTSATAGKVGLPVRDRFGVTTKPTADLDAHAPRKLGMMTVLAYQVLVRMLANGLGSVAVTRSAISGFARDIVMRFVTTGNYCANQQQQKDAHAGRRLPEALEQSLHVFDASHRETT